jgi:hypothetical protein
MEKEGNARAQRPRLHPHRSLLALCRSCRTLAGANERSERCVRVFVSDESSTRSLHKQQKRKKYRYLSVNAKLIERGQLGCKMKEKKRSGSEKAFVGFPPFSLLVSPPCAALNSMQCPTFCERELWLGQTLARHGHRLIGQH